MKQVVTRLMGGLGNQMFQYATGHSLATRLGVPLAVDRSFLDQRGPTITWTPRDYALDVFQAPVRSASPAEVDHFRKEQDDTTFRRMKRVLPFLFRDRCFVQKGSGFDPAFDRLAAPLYLEGFWQNERYFRDQATELREHIFVPKDAPSDKNGAVLNAITSCVSASLHVRRGDYVSLADANRYHGVVPLKYYASSAQWLAENRGVERFFIFSDDAAWVQENVQLPYPVTHVAHNHGRESHWDILLMKHCRHHIIANSSFSWWGAWLAPYADKVVIGPKRWFQGASDPGNDIMPPTWLRR